VSGDYGDQLITHRAPEGLLPVGELPAASSQTPRWAAPLALAATFLLGLGVGQWSATSPAADAPRAPTVLAEATLPLGTDQDPVPVRLVLYAPDADQVAVAGSFNGWDAGDVRLERTEDGLFHAVIHLPHGRHEYMFVVDGQRWVTDPTAALAVDDGFGNRNAVLEI
jgi:hypothetical protein